MNPAVYNLNISFKNIKGETVVHFLEKYQIYISTTSACTATTKNLDKTLIATFNDETRAINAVRISFSFENTIEEVDVLLEKIKELETI